MLTVYVLKLKHGKYYVGSTHRTVLERLNEHVQGLGSSYTKEHGVDDIYQVYPNASQYDETFITIKMMHTYGVNNVRGGPFCEINLSEIKKQMIDLLFLNFNEQCTLCGSCSHFVKECPKNTRVDVCFKCNQSGHYAKECTISKENDATIIDDPSTDELCVDEICLDQKLSNEAGFVTNEQNVDGDKISDCKNSCLNCGDQGHYAKNCPKPFICKKCMRPGHKSYECTSA